MAEAVPECSLKRDIARVTAFGAISPKQAIAQNNAPSNSQKLSKNIKSKEKAHIKASPNPSKVRGWHQKTSLAFIMLRIIKPSEFAPKTRA